MKTAVEWLLEQIKNSSRKTDLVNKEGLFFYRILQQAKEKEKQQIMDATYYGHLKGWVDDGVENSYGEQYYNETFKSEEL